MPAETKTSPLHDAIASAHPSLVRGQVWCRACGSTRNVDAATAMRTGWPKCCGYTMTIDSPAEREGLNGVPTDEQ